MFRVDSFDVIDATECGDAARFINHSCEVRPVIHTYLYLNGHSAHSLSWGRLYEGWMIVLPNG